MKVDYTVHSIHETTVPTEMTIEGRTVTVMTKAVIVEVVDRDHGHTFRFYPTDDELPELLETFQVGTTVTAQFGVSE